MKRAINVNIMGKKAYVIGGEKAGRFWSDTKTQPRRKSVRKGHRSGLGIGKRLVVVGCLTFFFLTYYMCWSNSQPNNFSKVVTDTIHPEILAETAQAADFESADQPAYTDLYDKYFKGKAPEARKVANCESGNRDVKSKMNKNGTYDYGRMQVNSIWLEVYDLKPSDLMQEETNIATAKQIYDRTGNFNAWSSSRKCWI